MEVNKIYQGNNLETLKTFPDNSIDSIVTDPPYGLGKEPDALEVLQSWITSGYHEIKGKGFMGKEWDAFVPQPNFWKECLRVLKPGGHLLSFAGTRTYDWMVIGLRIAGFEIRDQIAWVYGSGFPKSLDISKAIDKSMGAERTEVIGTRTRNIKPFDDNNGWNKNNTTGNFEYTAPSTDEAKQWQGWGTALKPALEPIVMARKPLGFEIDNINYVHEKLLEKNIEVKKWLSNVSDVEKQKNILYSILINLQVMGEIYVNNANLNEIKFIEKIIQAYIKKDIQNGETKTQKEQNKSQKTQMKNYVTKYLTTTDENVLVVVKIEKNFLHLTTSMEMVQNIDAKQEDILIEIYENKDFLKMDTEYFVGTVMRPLECMDIVHTIKKENINIKITQLSNIFLWDKNVDKKVFTSTTVAQNVLKHGVGGINIDGCRVETNDFQGKTFTMPNHNQKDGVQGIYNATKIGAERVEYEQNQNGRFPANFIISYDEDKYYLNSKTSKQDIKKVMEWLSENA